MTVLAWLILGAVVAVFVDVALLGAWLAGGFDGDDGDECEDPCYDSPTEGEYIPGGPVD